MTRKAKLEKALAFDEGNFETSNEATARGKWSYPSANRRLAPLHAALIEAVEALERSKKILDEIIHEKYSDDLVVSEMVDNDPAYIEILKQEEALAKIDEALEGNGGK